jgi:kynurenine formamidase
MPDPAVDAIIARVSNWGRWGEDDELGTLNHISPRARARAAGAVVSGQALSLAIPFGRGGPQPPGIARLNPQQTMLQTGTDVATGVQDGCDHGFGYSDDQTTFATHAATHWDALAHAFHDYRMYNNRPCTLVDATGAHANSIDRLHDRVVTRGVLVDVPRALGEPWLALGHEITVEQLERALELQRVELRAGDALLIRTGNLGRARRDGGWDRFTFDDEPGLGLAALPWIHEHEIAAIATDNWAFEVLPNAAGIFLPVHAAAIVHMGLLLGELFELDALADACAADGRYDFLLSAAPLPLVGAVGGPVNPIALR